MRLRCALVLAALALSCAEARAESPKETARALLEGEIEPAQAAQAWKRKRLKPDKVVKLLRTLLPLEKGPRGDHETELTDPHGRTSKARILMPEKIGKSGYGVLILLHGLGGSADDRSTGTGRLLAPPNTIVIAPSAQKPPADDKAEDLRTARLARIPVLKRFKHWWSYRQDAFPLLALEYLRRRYRIDTNRVLLAGYSMGGFGTWNLGLRFHDRFAGLAPLAGGLSREEFVPFLGKDKLTRMLLDNASMVPTFFIHGDADKVVPCKFDRWTHETLTARKVEHVYEEIEGGKHDHRGILGDDPLKRKLITWLRTRARDPHPTRVEHRAIGLYHGSAYWVRIDALSDSSGRVVAKIRPKNRIELECEKVSQLTLYLDPKRVKLKKKVWVTLGTKKILHRGKVRPSLLAVAESFARSHDPELTYTHALTVKVPD